MEYLVKNACIRQKNGVRLQSKRKGVFVMKKFAANLFLFGGLLILMAVVLPCSYVKAESDMPEYEIVSSTWDTITIRVTFTSASQYNKVSIYDQYNSGATSTSPVMYSKGTHTYTFRNLSKPDAQYYVTIFYGNGQSNVELSEFLVAYTAGIPEGKHVRIDLDYETYLKGNITYNNLKRWLNHLDAAYESYYNLVGAKPNNGRKIDIVSSDKYKEHYMWVFPNTSTIYWNKNYIADGFKQIDKYDDWHFGTLHEMGHLFDLDNRWTFDTEFFANFKMAYVFYERDGKFRVMINNKIVTKYSDIVNFYYSVPSGSYTKTIGADPMKYHNDGLTYMFLNGIKEFGSWDNFNRAFHYYVTSENFKGRTSSFGEFIGVVNLFSPYSNPFSYGLIEYYGDRYQFVEQYFANKSR